jgi:O-antigen ligase
MATSTNPAVDGAQPSKQRSSFGYQVMLVFSFLYYFRPGDLIPGLGSLHLSKVFGGLAVLALVFGSSRGRPKKMPTEVKLMLALFLWMVLCIPFAYWRGGSFDVVFWEFSKAVIVLLTLALTVSRTAELRRLIFVQALGVTLMTLVSVVVNVRMQGRLAGIGDGLLSNPNDLAMNIALNWPLCLVFLLRARNPLKKVFWALGMLIMIYAVMATYSRAGFLALMLAIVVCLWEFGVKGGRFYMLAAAIICAVFLLVLVPQNYSKRLGTLVGKFQQGDLDNGSAEARKELLADSVKVTALHPLFGVGPGNFPSYTRLWRVTHNTYLQFSSECGIPGLLFFLLLMARAFRNLGRTRKLLPANQDPELKLYTSALWAALAAYMLGALFASTAYELFPYYMVSYTMVLYRLAKAPEPSSSSANVQSPEYSYSPA